VLPLLVSTSLPCLFSATRRAERNKLLRTMEVGELAEFEDARARTSSTSGSSSDDHQQAASTAGQQKQKEAGKGRKYGHELAVEYVRHRHNENEALSSVDITMAGLHFGRLVKAPHGPWTKRTTLVTVNADGKVKKNEKALSSIERKHKKRKKEAGTDGAPDAEEYHEFYRSPTAQVILQEGKIVHAMLLDTEKRGGFFHVEDAESKSFSSTSFLQSQSSEPGERVEEDANTYPDDEEDQASPFTKMPSWIVREDTSWHPANSFPALLRKNAQAGDHGPGAAAVGPAEGENSSRSRLDGTPASSLVESIKKGNDHRQIMRAYVRRFELPSLLLERTSNEHAKLKSSSTSASAGGQKKISSRGTSSSSSKMSISSTGNIITSYENSSTLIVASNNGTNDTSSSQLEEATVEIDPDALANAFGTSVDAVDDDSGVSYPEAYAAADAVHGEGTCYPSDAVMHQAEINMMADRGTNKLIFRDHEETTHREMAKILWQTSFIYEHQFHVVLKVGTSTVYAGDEVTDDPVVGCPPSGDVAANLQEDWVYQKLLAVKAANLGPDSDDRAIATHMIVYCTEDTSILGLAFTGKACVTRGYPRKARAVRARTLYEHEPPMAIGARRIFISD